MTHKLMTTAEVAALLGVNPRTVQRLVTTSELTPVMTAKVTKNGAHLFAREDVERLQRARLARNGAA